MTPSRALTRDRHRVPVTRRELVLVLTITVSFGLLLTTWAYLTPSVHGPDELAHVDAVMHLAALGAWPPAGSMHYFQGLWDAGSGPTLPGIAARPAFGTLLGTPPLESPLVDPMSQHPQTYYLAQSAVADLLSWQTRRWDVVVLGMRLVDVVLMLPLPALVWATVRRATGAPRLAVAATTVLLAVPSLAQLGASVSVWVPVITAGAVVSWLAVRIATGDRSWLTTIGLGVAVAVGTATMAGGWIALPVAIAAVVASGPRRVGTWLRAAVVVAVPLVSTGWWYARNVVRTGTLQPDGLAAVSQPIPLTNGRGPDPQRFVGAYWNGLSDSFLGLVGRYEWSFTPIVVDTLTVVSLVAVVWALSRLGTRRRPPASPEPDAATRSRTRTLLLLALVFPVTGALVVLVRGVDAYVDLNILRVTQGRFLFPAVAAVLVVQALAWQVLVVDAHARRRLARSAVVVAPVIGAAGLALAYSGFYEGLLFRVSPDGLGLLAQSVTHGLVPLLALAVLTTLAVAVVVVLTWRWTGRPLDSRPTADRGPTSAAAQTTEVGAAPTRPMGNDTP